MWPWEHVVVAYVLYSLYARVWLLRPPGDRAALVVPPAALLPDLIDKPLAWQLSVLPAGRSLAHSLFFALPAVAVVALVARHLGEKEAGLAFGVAYISHLPADSFYAAVTTGDRVDLGYAVWPVGSVDPTPTAGLVDRLLEVLVEFAATVTAPGGWRFLALQATLLSVALGLWVLDGRPGLAPIRRALGSGSAGEPSAR